MGGASPPGFRPPRSWWLEQVLVGESDAAPVRGEMTADVCIVGGGYTGLWTALRCKERDPSVDVAVVEADVCGSGASGRNGGFAMTLWHHFIGLERVCGSSEALRLAHASEEAVKEIGGFCRTHGIDAQYRHDGWMWTATNQSQIGAWESTLAAIERHGESPFVRLDPEEVAARTGSNAHLAGVVEATSATVQPAILARGLRRVALEHGVRVYEHSPMVGLERSHPLRVHTPGGSLRAARVVLCTNAWGARLRELRRAFVVVGSDIAITAPAPEVLAQIGWADGMSVSDSRLMVHYYRTTTDGRVALGKGGGSVVYGSRIGGLARNSAARAAGVVEALHKLYPDLAGVPIAATWNGPIDRTIDGLPFFTPLGRTDLLAGMGFSGNGVATTVLAGRILSALALGIEDEWSRCGLVRAAPSGLPPEPFRYLGGRVVRGAVARRERAEDEGRTPSQIDRSIAALAPAGLVPIE